MKVRLLIDCDGPNPDFDPPDPRVDTAAHRRYVRENSPVREIPAGTEIEDPQAWILCLPDATGTVSRGADGKPVLNVLSERRIVRAEPIDDEAKEAVADYLASLDLDRRRADEKLIARALRAAQDRRDKAAEGGTTKEANSTKGEGSEPAAAAEVS
mgnify:CR=1 FL=1